VCFNEAAANRGGIRELKSGADVADPRFNEAAANRGGILDSAMPGQAEMAALQ